MHLTLAMFVLMVAHAGHVANMSPPSPMPSIPDKRFIEDMRKKNIEDVLSLYTPDAVFVDPEGHQFATPAALRTLYEQVFATYDSDLHIGGGHTAFKSLKAVETGHYSEYLRARATDTTQHVCGDFTFTWRRVDKDSSRDRWLLTRMEWTATQSCAVAPY